MTNQESSTSLNNNEEDKNEMSSSKTEAAENVNEETLEVPIVSSKTSQKARKSATSIKSLNKSSTSVEKRESKIEELERIMSSKVDFESAGLEDVKDETKDDARIKKEKKSKKGRGKKKKVAKAKAEKTSEKSQEDLKSNTNSDLEQKAHVKIARKKSKGKTQSREGLGSNKTTSQNTLSDVGQIEVQSLEKLGKSQQDLSRSTISSKRKQTRKEEIKASSSRINRKRKKSKKRTREEVIKSKSTSSNIINIGSQPRLTPTQLSIVKSKSKELGKGKSKPALSSFSSVGSDFSWSSLEENQKPRDKVSKKAKIKEDGKEKETGKVDFDIISEKIAVEKPTVVKKKGKKEKAKKTKAVKQEELEDKPEIEVSIPDLQKLLPVNYLEGNEVIKEDIPEVTKVPVKKKKKPKKKKGPKLTEKQRERLEEERRIAAEEEALRLAEEERLRAIQERKMAIAKEKRDVLEQQWREEELEFTEQQIAAMKQAGWDAIMKTKEEKEWEEYLVCDGLPNPGNVPEMNTYLHMWEKELNTVTVEKAVHRTNEMQGLLDELQKLIDDPFDEPERKQADWKWIRSLFRYYQKQNLDFCTYRLLRDVKNRMNRLDIPSADFRLKEKYFSLCLWTLVELPTPTPNPRQPSRPRVNLEWPEFDMTVVFPTSLKCDLLALRGMFVMYDHLSDTSKSHDLPSTPEVYNKTFIEMIKKEWYTKLRYKYDKRVIPQKEPQQVILEDGSTALIEPEPEPELLPGELPPLVPYQKLDIPASDHAMSIEKQEFHEALNSLIINMDAEKINLRKYFIIGGIFYLDLFHQPPQPQEMVSFEIFITTLQSPFCLQEAPFYVTYDPPPAPEPGVRRQPEEIEEELLIQERELDKLMFITLTLPTHVFWLDVPMVAHWNENEQEWSTADIHDFKHIEEKGYITFRTGRFGPFGIATYRFPNLPYQAWEIRPEKDGTVTLQLTAAILMIEFHFKNHLVCISQLQNAPNAAMDDYIGVYYKLPRLKRILLECGVDVFPSFDSFHYIKGACEKHWPLEKHLYYCLAMASAVYNFSWSRWNMTLDYRGIALQMRRYKFDKNKQDNFSMVLVTPIKAAMIECTEVSTTFSEEPFGGETKFYADLIHLIRGVCNTAARNKMGDTPLEMINTIANLFIETRFLSFS